MKFYSLIPILLPALAECQAVGKPFGFATGVTGGGSATPAAPSDITQLKSWLADATPRVILINKTFDFRGSEGTTTGQVCQDNVTGLCPGGSSAGQSSITTTCDTTRGKWISGSWDTAGRTQMKVASNKSIIGVGSSGIIMGKGLALTGGVSNIIIQNVWFTNINPQYVWGGDGILLSGCDKVWIDHCKFSLMGRQFLVSGFDAAGHVTISNNEFDGVTSWSSSCNGDHYWVMLFAGALDYYTLAGNWIHHFSGRSPHIGTTVDVSTIWMHAYNNLWENGGGHSFDIDKNTYMLIEANQFTSALQPITPASSTNGGHIFDVPSSSNTGTCSSYLGRNCVVNGFSSSGSWTSFTDTSVLSQFQGLKSYLGTPAAASSVSASVKANAGIGKISQTSVTTTKTTTKATTAATTTSTSKTTTKATTTTAGNPATQTLYGQCGGIGWTGPTVCASGSTCTFGNDYYSQCLA
ncbi:hypothetical protein TWF694_003330 [Orbilia ellipsospora]|uniref:pectin lyase n=1 Tax=Orbilia ellipsospora TaxID=2528407 RepID=A0AAV9X155_9PEZI